MCATTQQGKISPYLAGDYYVLSEKEFGSLISKFTLGLDGQVSGDLEFLFKTLNIPDSKNYPTVKWSMDERGAIALFFCNEHVCKYQSRISLYGISEDSYKVSAVYNNYTGIVKGLQFADQKVYYPFVKNSKDYEYIINMKSENKATNLSVKAVLGISDKLFEQLLKGINKDDIYSFTLLQDQYGDLKGDDDYNKYVGVYCNDYENPELTNRVKLKFDEFEFNSRKSEYNKIKKQKYVLIKFTNMDKCGVDNFDFKKSAYVFENFEDIFFKYGTYENFKVGDVAKFYRNSTGNFSIVPFLKYNKPLLLKMEPQAAKNFQDNYLVNKKFNDKVELYILAKVIKPEAQQYRDYECKRINTDDKYLCSSYNTVNFKQVIINPIKALAVDKTSNEKIFISE